MLFSCTARYTPLNKGLVEWPEVVTEGIDLDDCRLLLRDALNEMILAYQALGQDIHAKN
ncbi:type II toxin-antitoxin system HicB family antitoxin [Chromatium okenii]|uniref:type II toxin-antitoxin system HicB family antitoxin n=1 Tax=Chromatium okenii TaxID=61644 RepID=UPI0019057C94|nr:type II toxin-antitoxin system HicB family antitoxin [Chromatium okenii]